MTTSGNRKNKHTLEKGVVLVRFSYCQYMCIADSELVIVYLKARDLSKYYKILPFSLACCYLRKKKKNSKYSINKLVTVNKLNY